MFGIGMPEFILILAIALIVIGPKKLPGLAKSMGRALGEFRKATGELKETLTVDTELGEVKKAFDDVNKDIKDTLKTEPADVFPDAHHEAAEPTADSPPGDNSGDPVQPPPADLKQAFDEFNAETDSAENDSQAVDDNRPASPPDPDPAADTPDSAKPAQ